MGWFRDPFFLTHSRATDQSQHHTPRPRQLGWGGCRPDSRQEERAICVNIIVYMFTLLLYSMMRSPENEQRAATWRYGALDMYVVATCRCLRELGHMTTRPFPSPANAFNFKALRHWHSLLLFIVMCQWRLYLKYATISTHCLRASALIESINKEKSNFPFWPMETRRHPLPWVQFTTPTWTGPLCTF